MVLVPEGPWPFLRDRQGTPCRRDEIREETNGPVILGAPGCASRTHHHAGSPEAPHAAGSGGRDPPWFDGRPGILTHRHVSRGHRVLPTKRKRSPGPRGSGQLRDKE